MSVSQVGTMATAKIAIKESLLGTTKEPELSTQSKATFNRHARQDDETQEPFMTQDDFVNAIAPPGEDYVSASISFTTSGRPAVWE